MRPVFHWLVRNKIRAACLSVGWAAFIFAGCLLPGKDVPSLTIFQYDKLVHFGIFAVLAFLCLAVYKYPGTVKNSLKVLLICTAYGYAVELLQGSGLVEGRSCDLYDALADSIGALIGILVFHLFRKLCAEK
jgi:VanZ family protein